MVALIDPKRRVADDAELRVAARDRQIEASRLLLPGMAYACARYLGNPLWNVGDVFDVRVGRLGILAFQPNRHEDGSVTVRVISRRGRSEYDTEVLSSVLRVLPEGESTGLRWIGADFRVIEMLEFHRVTHGHDDVSDYLPGAWSALLARTFADAHRDFSRRLDRLDRLSVVALADSFGLELAEPLSLSA